MIKKKKKKLKETQFFSQIGLTLTMIDREKGGEVNKWRSKNFFFF